MNRHFYCSGAGYWSYPAFQISAHGRVQWVHIGLGFELQERRTLLYRPRALAVTEANSTILVHYEDFKEGLDPFPQMDWHEHIAVYPHETICEWTDETLHAEEMKLFALYPEAEDEFAAAGSLPQAFRKRYLTLSHPIFSRCLIHLAPAFSKALSNAEKESA